MTACSSPGPAEIYCSLCNALCYTASVSDWAISASRNNLSNELCLSISNQPSVTYLHTLQEELFQFSFTFYIADIRHIDRGFSNRSIADHTGAVIPEI